MSYQILRELIHALKVEQVRHNEAMRHHAAEEIRKVIVVLLCRLPEVIECKGQNLRCTVTGSIYSVKLRRSELSIDQLLNRVYGVSTYSYFAAVEARRKAWDEVYGLSQAGGNQ